MRLKDTKTPLKQCEFAQYSATFAVFTESALEELGSLNKAHKR